MQEPAELVDRACTTVKLLSEEFRKRGWFTAVPAWDEIKKQALELRQKTEKEEEAAQAERAKRRLK